MRTVTVTLLLMLAAAAGIILGGVRLARFDVVTRTPADRVRLEEFTDAFAAELSRLDELYAQHLSRVAGAMDGQRTTVRAVADTTIGIAEAHFISEKGALESVRVHGAERTPEFVVEGGKTPLNRANAIVFPRELPDMPRGWLGAQGADWRVFWQRGQDTTIALLVDMRKVRTATARHVAAWLPGAFAPLREAGELVQIRSAGGVLAGIAAPPASPIALTVPLRNSLGAWELAAWDRVTTRTAHDPSTLAVSITAGALLAALGALLFHHHRRALRLAEERVSFVNRVSHELGSPLTNALLNLSLADDALDAHPARARSRLRLVTEEIQRLARLVGNVLTFSRRERGTLRLTPDACVPDDIISAVIAQFDPALARRGIRVEWRRGAADGVSLAADALAQIAGNLISNVEKYAAPGGWLGITTALDGGTLVLRVADRGPGIPARDRERVFEPFERAESRVDEGSSGTGLGLAIARDLAARMDGTLLLVPVESGACFELRVPAPSIITAIPSAA